MRLVTLIEELVGVLTARADGTLLRTCVNRHIEPIDLSLGDLSRFLQRCPKYVSLALATTTL